MIIDNHTCSMCGYPFFDILHTTSLTQLQDIPLDKDFLFEIILCQKCGYVRQGNLLPESILDEYYQKYAFNFASSGKENDNIRVAEWSKANSRYEFIKPYITVSNQKILEIGCGDGKLLSMFNNNRTQCVGVEINENHHIANKELGNEVYKTTNHINEIDYHCFSLIILSHVLEHLPNPKNYLQTLIDQFLNSAGMLFVEVPNEYVLDGKNNYSIEHVSYFFPHTLIFLIESLGLKLLDFEKVEYDVTPSSLRLIATKRDNRDLNQFYDGYKKRMERSQHSYQQIFKIPELISVTESPYALFGAGEHAESFIFHCEKKPRIILDNNTNKHGSNINGVPVVGVNEIDKYKNIHSVIITSWASGAEIKFQLLSKPFFQKKKIYLLRDFFEIH